MSPRLAVAVSNRVRASLGVRLPEGGRPWLVARRRPDRYRWSVNPADLHCLCEGDLALLDHPQWIAREQAVVGLGELGDESVVAALARCCGIPPTGCASAPPTHCRRSAARPRSPRCGTSSRTVRDGAGAWPGRRGARWRRRLAHHRPYFPQIHRPAISDAYRPLGKRDQCRTPHRNECRISGACVLRTGQRVAYSADSAGMVCAKADRWPDLL